ncbi:hypothetical protein MUCCIDRAFT_114039 [Mucor lusitanicus CBS 277.49]|uniref:Uncharacterized protein n=2 Tax=Mucor circinelloides f. lusitanicus TaxID=29924 RepID=A0A168IZH6_MUCCL|nr:hypothetical protein MUCCIDRAFT_114039 [Mucor lusitanicus CBS 277.49]
MKLAQVTTSLLSAFENEGIQEVNQALESLRNLVESDDGYLDLSRDNQEEGYGQGDQQNVIQRSNQENAKRKDEEEGPSLLSKIASNDDVFAFWQGVDFDKDPIFNKARKMKSPSELATSSSPPLISFQKASYQQQQQQQHQHQQIPFYQHNYEHQHQPKMTLKQLIDVDEPLMQLAACPTSSSSASTTPATYSSSSNVDEESSVVSGRSSSSLGFENKPTNSRVAHLRTTASSLVSQIETWKLQHQTNVSQANLDSGVKKAARPDDNWTKPEKIPDIMTAQVSPWPIRKRPPGPRSAHPDAGDTESEGDDEQEEEGD